MTPPTRLRLSLEGVSDRNCANLSCQPDARAKPGHSATLATIHDDISPTLDTLRVLRYHPARAADPTHSSFYIVGPLMLRRCAGRQEDAWVGRTPRSQLAPEKVTADEPFARKEIPMERRALPEQASRGHQSSDRFRMSRGVGIALLMLCMGLAMASPVLGQGAGASIEGTLRDQQGAGLPGATVTLRNEETGVSRTTATDTEGHYRFLALAPGRYQLTAELSGFATADVGNIAIPIGRAVQQDFVMGIQALEESVTVSGVAPAVDTTKSEVAGVVTQHQIQTLPVNSRQYLTLAPLMPATSQDAGRSFYNNVTVGAGTTFYSNGFTVDGVSNTWAEEGEPRQNFPQGAVEEFKVPTVGFPAEMGLASGGL